MNFRNARKKLGPRWLTTAGESGLVGYSLDVVKDAFMRRLELGHLARFPQNDPTGETTAPEDALAALGRDRGIPRGIDESSSSYARRLLGWLDDRKRQGNPFELMHQLAGYLNDPTATFRTVDVHGSWYARAADGTETSSEAEWNWDGIDYGTRWSRFWVVINPGARWNTSAVWGDGDWGDGRTWGTSATREQVVTVQAITNTWKPAGTRCLGHIVDVDDTFIPGSPLPDGNYARWSRVIDGVRVPARRYTARYLDGDPNYNA